MWISFSHPYGMEKTITLRVPQEWLDKVDAWIDGQPIPVSRSDLIRTVVEEYIGERPVEGDRPRKEKRPRGKPSQTETAGVAA
jgi:Arc/MetJ-type ribon-helix-helix transcriptional regulator